MDSRKNTAPKSIDHPTADRLPVVDVSQIPTNSGFTDSDGFLGGTLGVAHAGGIWGIVTGIALGIGFISPVGVIAGAGFGYAFGFFIAFTVAIFVFPICWIINASMKFVLGPRAVSAIAGGLTAYTVGHLPLAYGAIYRMTWNQPTVLITMGWITMAMACGMIGGYVRSRPLSNLNQTVQREHEGKHRFHFDLRQILVATAWIAVAAFIIKNYPISLAAIVWFAVCQTIAALLAVVGVLAWQKIFKSSRSPTKGFLSGSGSHSSGTAVSEHPEENHWF